MIGAAETIPDDPRLGGFTLMRDEVTVPLFPVHRRRSRTLALEIADVDAREMVVVHGSDDAPEVLVERERDVTRPDAGRG